MIANERYAKKTVFVLGGLYDHSSVVTKPLFEKDGGHGMIFKTFEGELRLVLHSPNGGGLERAHLFELEDCGDTLKLKGEVK